MSGEEKMNSSMTMMKIHMMIQLVAMLTSINIVIKNQQILTKTNSK